MSPPPKRISLLTIPRELRQKIIFETYNPRNFVSREFSASVSNDRPRRLPVQHHSFNNDVEEILIQIANTFTMMKNADKA